MIYRYTEYYKTLKDEFRDLTLNKSQVVQNSALKKSRNSKKKTVTWGDVPKPRGWWAPEKPTKKQSAEEPQLLLGGLSLIEARRETLKEDCVIMDRLKISNEKEYQKWYEQNKDTRGFETLLPTVSGCVQAGLYAGSFKGQKKLEDLDIIL
jgi:hypothetical protein